MRLQMKEHSLEVDLQEVTPATAKAMLDRNTSNRKFKKDNIRSLVKTLKDGDWTLNGQPIIFDRDGALADGQHRLEAVVQSSVPAVSLVVCGVEPLEAQDTQDNGVKRSVADQLTLHGYHQTKELASVLGGLADMRDLGEWPSSKRFRLTVPRALRMVEGIPNYQDILSLAGSVRKSVRLPASVGGTLNILFNEVDPIDSAEFWNLLMSGSGLDETDPILKLRNRLLADAAKAPGSGKMSNRHKAALTIKAWNLWRAGESVTNLIWRTGGAQAESFPRWDIEAELQ